MADFFPHKLINRFSSGFILAFHELSAQRLAEFVEALHPSRPIPLSELVKRSKLGKRTGGLFAITVDDGIGETVRDLVGLFQSRSWPGTFYLATQYVDNHEEMLFQWWRKITPLLPLRRLELKSDRLELKSETIDLSAPSALKRLSAEMERRWHFGRLESYVPLIHELADVAARENGTTVADLRPSPVITWEEVEAMSKNHLIDFESHGVSHAAMSALTDEELRFELRHSQEAVTERTGRPCRHLAYPFGSPASIGNRAPAAAREFYDSATTMALGHVDAADPWLLPRIPLYPENSIFMARAKVLLKCVRGSSRHQRGRQPLDVETPAVPQGISRPQV